MFTLWGFFMSLALLAAIVMVGLILLQQGKGADMGASFGAGASGSLFGATGSANPLSKATAWAAAIFLGSTLGLTYIGYQQNSGKQVNPAAVSTGSSVLDHLNAGTAPTEADAQAAIDNAATPEAAAPAVPAAEATAAPEQLERPAVAEVQADSSPAAPAAPKP